MRYFLGILVVVIFCLIFVFSYYLNNKIKIECDNDDLCEGCKVESCYRNIKKEEN